MHTTTSTRRIARLTLAAVLTASAVAASGGAGSSATAAESSQQRQQVAKPAHQVYVALGDSFSAGPLIAPQAELPVCARSAVNYPALLAKKLKVKTFRDVTCSSATTYHFRHRQPGNVSGKAIPQYAALSKSTTLVTVGIGGNDIGLVGLAESCINLLPSTGIVPLPLLGKSCKATNTAGGVDRYARRIDRFAPTYGKVIEQIRKRAPRAKIVMVGYPTGIQRGGCYPFVPLLPQDANYVQHVINRLNRRMSQQAKKHGATYVDLRTPSIGHDACQGIGIKWIEGVLPTVVDNGTFPLHPNAAGMRHAVPAILKALRRS